MRQIEGRNPVIEALKADLHIEKIYIQQNSKGQVVSQIQEIAAQKGITVENLEKSNIEKIATSSVHQGVIAIAEDYHYADIEDILNYARAKNEPPLIVVLDQIQDPNNLGSIIRTANALGVHGIIIPKHRASEVTSAVSRASAGAVEMTRVARVTNLARVIDELKEEGLWFVGGDAEANEVIYGSDLKGPLGIVIGNEGSGLRRLVKEKCDFLVKIPMYGQINSLNASVAAGIFMYEVIRQRYSS